MPRVIYSPEAEDDLLAIGGYIARDSPIRARTFIIRMEKRIDTLAVLANRGRWRPEIGPQIRSLPTRPVAFYRVIDEGETVQIVRIIDSRRDLRTLFFQE